MGLSADAIGFILQLDDQLTPGLAKAAKGYAKFTKDIDRQNQRAVKSIGKAFAQMASLAESFEKLPQQVSQSYRRTAQAVNRQQKPMKVKVELSLSGKRLDREIANAVTAGLRGAGRRMKTPAGGAGAPAVLQIPSSYTPARNGAARAYQEASNQRSRELAARRSGQPDNNMRSFSTSMSAAGTAVARGGAGQARQQLMTAFASLTPAQRKKVLNDYTKVMGVLRQTAAHERDMAKSMTVMGRMVGVVRSGWGATAGFVGNIAKNAREIAGNTRFTAMITAMDRFSGMFASGHQFFQGMNDLNKSLHLSRADLAKMEQSSIAIAGKYDGLLDPGNIKDAMMSLAKFGARATEEFEKLAPTVALAVQAMDISGDTAAGLARKLGTNFKMSKDEVAGVFANISRVGGATGVSAEELAGGMTDNATRAGAFLKGLSPGDRQGVLGNMASLQGVLTKNFGDSGNKLGSLIADALSDATSDSARTMMNLSGLTGGSDGTLGAALKSGDLSAITSGIAGRASQAGGNATVATQMASALGFPGSGGEFLTFAQSIGDMNKDLASLQAGGIAAGNGFQRLADDAAKASSDIDKYKKQIKTSLAEILPSWMLQGLGELSTSGTGLAAGGFLAGIAGRGLGKVPVLGGLLRSLPLIGPAFGTAAAPAAGAAAGGLGRAAAGGLGRTVAGVAGRGAGLLGGLLGPLALALTPTTLGSAEEAPGMAEARRAAAPRQTMAGFDQLAHMEGGRMYRAANPVSSAVFGVDWDEVGKKENRSRAEANVSQVYGLKPGGQIPIADIGDFEARMSSRPLTSVEIAAASAAAAQRDADRMRGYQAMSGMMPGFGSGFLGGAKPTTPAAAPAPRDTPADNVVKSFAQSNY